MKNSFISFEGLDASGKTTLLSQVKIKLQERGYKVSVIGRKYIKFNDDTMVGLKLGYLNNILYTCDINDNLNNIPPYAWLLMNSAWFTIVSKAYLVDTDHDIIYLTDSWIYKRMSRFLLIDDVCRKDLENIYKEVKKPDISFFIDATPEITWERRKTHSNKDFGLLNNEKSNCTKERFFSFQNIIYENYKQYAIDNNWYVLSGTDAISYWVDQVIAIIDQNVKQKG